MSKLWKISNIHKQRGMLGEIDHFIGPGSERTAMSVSVPFNFDENLIKHAAASLVTDAVRSFEMWWDGEEKKLHTVLATVPDDAEIYKQAFLNMYPSAGVTPLENPNPAWYDPTAPYKIFDIGYYHGHFAAAFAADEAQWLLSNVASTIQTARYAWIQVVFCKHNFTPLLHKHVNSIGRHNNRIQKNIQGGSILDGLKINFSGKPKATEKREHPEANGDFKANYPALNADSTKKRQGPHTMVSIRGLIDTGTISDINVVNSISFEPIKCAYDYLTTFLYRHKDFYERDLNKAHYIHTERQQTMRQRIDMFPLRLLPDVEKIGYDLVGKYVNSSTTSNYKPRRSPPYIIAIPSEMATYLHLPKPSTPNLASTTRGTALPSQQINKPGYNIGFFEHKKIFDQKAYYRQFGREFISSAIDAVTISPADFAYHVYAPGGTGSGKSSIIKVLLKHLEMANIYASLPQDTPVGRIPCDPTMKNLLADLDQEKTLKELGIGWANACIYFDPKGDDSELFVRQCERSTLNSDKIHYLDPSKTNFTLNPLELPPHDPDERDAVVDLYVGYFFDMIKGWYGNADAFVRMNRILHNLLLYLYVGQDKPTFADMYEMIQNIQEDDNYLQVMYDTLGKPSKELDMALKSIAGMDAKSFEPVLNRLEKFVTSKQMRQMFCRRKSTINFRELIEPGHYTVVRFSESDIALDKINLAMSAFVMKLWFEVSYRSSIVPIKDRTQVVLALDEFQKLKNIEVLETMISQARSKGLGLILAHQSLKQIDDKDLSSITTNFGMQMAGHLEGNDAQRLASAWDPKYVNEIKENIATQPKYHWTAKIAPAAGQEQPLPVRFWTHFDPIADEVCRSNITDEEWKKFVAKEKERYKSDEEELSIFDAKAVEENRWRQHTAAEFIKHEYWHIMSIIQHRTVSLAYVTEKYNPTKKEFDGTDARDVVSKILQEMADPKVGLVTKDEGRKGKYSLTQKAKDMLYFEPNEIGTSPDIKEAVRNVRQYYLAKGYFLAIAMQKVRKGKYRTDMVAYDYNTKTPISVEIESEAEMESHPEHVRFNMMKWRELGFKKCDIWSYAKNLEELYNALAEGTVKKSITAFVMDHATDDVQIFSSDPESMEAGPVVESLESLNAEETEEDQGDDGDSGTIADDTANNDEPQVSEPGDDDINNVGPVEVVQDNGTASEPGDDDINNVGPVEVVQDNGTASEPGDDDINNVGPVEVVQDNGTASEPGDDDINNVGPVEVVQDNGTASEPGDDPPQSNAPDHDEMGDNKPNPGSMDSEDAPQASETDDSKPAAKQKEGIDMDSAPDTWHEESGETGTAQPDDADSQEQSDNESPSGKKPKYSIFDY